MAILALALALASPALHQPDTATLVDPMRPVTEIRRDGFALHWFTKEPTETRIQLREAGVQAVLYSKSPRPDPWKGSDVLTLNGPDGKRREHRLAVNKLKAGKRYYYRVYDPGMEPTGQEKTWGAAPPWRREYAVSTLAPQGNKSIIHIPIKVLIMPNVVNVESAYLPDGTEAPKPAPATDEQIELAKQEMLSASKFYWVNSGMRLWIDFEFYIDRRWQSWGPVPEKADPFYKNWPVSRSWAGVDYAGPGGGDFNFVDTKDIEKVYKEPIEEEVPYTGQIELAWTQKWNPTSKKWEYYGSGGGTLGVDGLPDGHIGRSQYLGGSDIAWLTCHEFHHQLESTSTFSLSNREDERIVFNHYWPRERVIKSDGKVSENTWATSSRHGEHWDGMAYWDRTLTDAQWLRTYFGETIVVKDRDNDGFPDDDPRLPLDEKRFGSKPNQAKSDGRITDLQKVMLSHWTPSPLQSTWTKPGFQGRIPKPLDPDSDGDGLEDGVDPYALEPWPNYVWPMRAIVDGDDSEWKDVPASGEMDKGGIQWTYKHAHDEVAYFGSMVLKGPWKKAIVTLDGEGLGVYSNVGVQGFTVENGPELKIGENFAEPKGMVWKATQKGDETVFEFSLPNRGEGIWYWNRGGREIGLVLQVSDDKNRLYSVHEPYRLFYCRMLEPNGQFGMPESGQPEDISKLSNVVIVKPGASGVTVGNGWKVVDGKWAYDAEEESPIYVGGLKQRFFDFCVKMEASKDAVLGAYLPNTQTMSAGEDYIAFVGGYANTVTRMRIFGEEKGDASEMLTPGVHTVQLSRRQSGVWVLFDGKPILWTPDPNPSALVDRLAVLGGYQGSQRVHEIRYRLVD